MRTMFVVGAVAAVGAAGLVKFAMSAQAPPGADVSSVYAANYDAASVSALDMSTLSQVVPNISTDPSPAAVSVSHDGTRVYTANRYGSVNVIDATTDTRITAVSLDPSATVTDVVVSPDDSRVFGTLQDTGRVGVMDTATNTKVDSFPLPVVASNTPRPQAIDITPDGATLFVLSVNTARVEKLNAGNGTSLGGVGVSPFARELKVSADGSTVIVVGDDTPEFFSTSTLAPVSDPSTFDVGTQVDLAVAGSRVYVLNQALNPQPPTAKPAGRPKFAQVIGPSIDVYEAATGAYVESIMLPNGNTVLGIAVTADATQAFFSSTGAENPGSVTAVNLVSKTVGTTGSTGSNPVRIALKETLVTTPVVSYFLPRVVVVKLKGTGKDTLVASGFFDEGGFDPDYDQDVTVDVGGFTTTFKLLANKKRTSFRNIQNQGTVRFGIVPKLKGSSRGRFTIKLFKTTLTGLIDPGAPVEFHFHATGLPETVGKVQLQQGKYRFNHARGELFEPPFFPSSAKSKIGAQGKDTLLFKGGFATSGPTPANLGTVRFGFGPSYFKTIDGSLFPAPKKETFKYTETLGKTKFTISINFLKEVVIVSAKNVELGTLDGTTVDVVFDAGNGAGAIRETIRVSKIVTTQRNY